MAITTLDGYIASAKQDLLYSKTTARTTVAASWFSLFDLAGGQSAGTLAGVNTANGVVPTDATAGYPVINGGAATNYLGNISYNNTVACTISIYDRLFVAGAYAFNANTALATQPSYAGRLPNTDYTQTELWVEQVTAATGNQAVTVTYTNQSGTGTRSTGAVGIGAAPTVGRCWQLPLQSGDSGIQRIDNVLGTVATVGTFNVMVLRPLVKNLRVNVANAGGLVDAFASGLRQIYADSAIYVLVNADSTSSGLPNIQMQAANG